MTPTQRPLLASPHRNQQLFSDHYLDVALPQRPDWYALANEARPIFERITAIYRAYAPSDNEAQTEKDVVRPVLDALGHTFEVQAALATAAGTKRPDYVFYRDTAALRANKGKTLTEDLLQGKAFAVGDAKHWDRALDAAAKQASADPFTNKNPSYQIWYYMEQSGVAWGILTNGRLWRLYHKDTAHRLDRFYEVDLPALLATGDVEQFLYFYAFFARSSFEPHALGVAALLRESVEFARGIGDTFKAQVYDALRHLAQGFLDYAPNGLQADPATLRAIYDNGLIVLYRLLFVLYAEARELLPVRESELYRDPYSLYAIKHGVARDLRRGTRLLPSSVTLWPKLKTLFTIINEGSPPLKVATFNGGLFDPDRHPFLERYSVGDAHLQLAIDKLTRVDGQFVDYRDLAEQHLGTIYQGLLEYHLEAIPPEDGWSVALLNDKGERHATGSYYTPDFIVKYMVEQTLGPILRAAVAHARDDEARIAAVLDVNVLDPAMGSGYFLVEATEYIARFLVELGVRPQGDAGGEADLAYWRRRVAQSCIYGVDLNPLAVDLAKLSLWLITVAKDRPLSFLDHHLRPGNSLVGARIADLQRGTGGVPGRKTSSRKARQAEQAVAAGQLTLFSDDAFRQSMSTAVDAMWLIEASPAQTVEQVKEQEHIYARLHEALVGKYGALADLVTAAHVGVEIDPAQWPALADYVMGRSFIVPQKQASAYAAWLEAAERAARGHRFFHWELEFPEVFFTRYGEPKGDGAGFDAVIGNPPYVRQEQLAPFKPYFAATYPETYDGVADLYVYFYQQGLQLTRAGGRMAYIVTNKWLRAGYGEPLRAYFAARAVLERIVDFGHAPIFEDADVFPCIVVLERPASDEASGEIAAHAVEVTSFPREELRKVELGRYVREHSHAVPQGRFGGRPWSLETSAVDDLMAKIERVGMPLAEFAGVKPYRGVLTGLNEAFLIDTATRERLVREDVRCAEIIKPYLRGQDIKRWAPDWQGLWMIFARRGIDIDSYPAIKQHLLRFREQLEPKPKDWTGTNWPGRKSGSYRWYEIQDSVEYWKLFEGEKIIYQEIQFHSCFAMDSEAYFTNNKGFLLPTANLYLLAVLNSPLMWWHNWRYLPHMKDEALTPVGELMVKLPIAPASDDARVEVELATERLIEITRANREAGRDMLDWLHTEFGIDAPGQKLEDFARLDADAFVAEVRKRRRKALGMLSPAALKALRAGYAGQAAPIRQRQAEAVALERAVSDLVNAAYGLTPREVALLWETAPPRMPLTARADDA